MAKSAEQICREAAAACVQRIGQRSVMFVFKGTACRNIADYATPGAAVVAKDELRDALAADYLRVHHEIEQQAQT